jgi:hypothetical protein
MDEPGRRRFVASQGIHFFEKSNPWQRWEMIVPLFSK